MIAGWRQLIAEAEVAAKEAAAMDSGVSSGRTAPYFTIRATWQNEIRTKVQTALTRNTALTPKAASQTCAEPATAFKSATNFCHGVGLQMGHPGHLLLVVAGIQTAASTVMLANKRRPRGREDAVIYRKCKIK